MKSKWLTRLLCLWVIGILFTHATGVSANSHSRAVGEAQVFADGIVAYKLKEAGASSVQEWIDGSLTKNAGTTAEWYILALSQSGEYDFSRYEKALKAYVSANTVHSASSRQKYALVLAAVGSTDGYISSTMGDSIGKQGVMSWVYGLYLLNNGYTGSVTAGEAVAKLLSLQFEDGGWAISGTRGDTDVTAMVLSALAPHREGDTAVKQAVDKALSLLSSYQRDSGDYASYGVPNAESTAQVLTALSSLGIDCQTDSRFIKGGNTLFDGLAMYRSADGAFFHKAGDAPGNSAMSQTLYSLIAYLRMINGKSGLYLLDNCDPEGVIPAPTTSASQEGTSAQGATSSTATAPNTTTAPSLSGATAAAQTTNAPVSDYTSHADSTFANTEPTGSVGTTVNGTAAPKKTDGGYKPWVCLILILIAAILWFSLYLAGKGHKKNGMVILALTVFAVAFVCFTDFQSAESYYSGEDTPKEGVVGTVTLTIRCDTVAGRASHIPDDGIILDTTEFDIEEGDTVYDILVEATRKYGIHMENSGSEGMVYIAGIHYLYEFDFGDLSGWIYHVNGESSSVGCDSYVLSENDTIEWLYTCELGNDLK